MPADLFALPPAWLHAFDLVVEVYTLQTWTLVYTAGEAGIKPGGGLRIGLRHLQNWHAEMPQTNRPHDSGYLTAEGEGGVPVDISLPRSSQLSSQYFAWQNLVQATVGQPGLKPGEQLRIDFDSVLPLDGSELSVLFDDGSHRIAADMQAAADLAMRHPCLM